MIRCGRFESHTVPRDVAQRVARVGGLNRFNDPNFRVVWGGSRLDALGFQRYAYSPALLQRWIVEVWRPPEAYGSRREWDARAETLGPFPSRGDYELLAALDRGGEYAGITPDLAEYAIAAYRKSREMTHWDRRALLVSEVENRDRDWDTFADGVLDANSLPFYGKSAVYQ